MPIVRIFSGGSGSAWIPMTGVKLHSPTRVKLWWSITYYCHIIKGATDLTIPSEWPGSWDPEMQSFITGLPKKALDLPKESMNFRYNKPRLPAFKIYNYYPPVVKSFSNLVQGTQSGHVSFFFNCSMSSSSQISSKWGRLVRLAMKDNFLFFFFCFISIQPEPQKYLHMLLLQLLLLPAPACVPEIAVVLGVSNAFPFIWEDQ